MAAGTVKRIIADRMFGFVRADDNQEFFFHRSAVKDTPFEQLREGQRVTFEIGDGAKGPRAENVRLEAE